MPTDRIIVINTTSCPESHPWWVLAEDLKAGVERAVVRITVVTTDTCPPLSVVVKVVVAKDVTTISTKLEGRIIT